jgi:hypothetical protein
LAKNSDSLIALQVKDTTMKPDKLFRWLPITAAILAVNACTLNVENDGNIGTGSAATPTITEAPTVNPSGSVTPTNTITPTTTVTSTGTPELNIVLNGVVAQSVDGSGALADSPVEILVKNGSDTLKTVNTSTDEDGRFAVVVDDVDNSSGDISVSISTSNDGFTDGTKLVSGVGQSGDVTVAANLVVASEATEVETLTGVIGSILSFGQSLGVFEIIPNAYQPLAKEGSDVFPLIDVELPSSWVNAETVSAVIAGFKAFNPNESTQIQAYPGDFIGFGDSDGSESSVILEVPDSVDLSVFKRLIPSVFAQVKLRDQDSQPLVLSADGSDNMVVRIEIPVESYGTILEDKNAAAEGIQVPVYGFAYRWFYVGNATLVAEDSDNPGSFTNYPGSVENINAATANINVFAQIDITNIVEPMPWVSISWPIEETQDTRQVCINENVQFAQLPQGILDELNVAGNTGLFNGYAELALPDGSFDWSYVSNGVLNYQTTLGSDGIVNVSIFNPLTGQYQQFSQGFSSEDVLDDNGCISLDFSFADVVELDNPLTCAITGQLTDSDSQGLASRPVVINSGDYHKLVISNDEGYFAAPALCGVEQKVSASLGGSIAAKLVYPDGIDSVVNGMGEEQTPYPDEAADIGVYADENEQVFLGSLVKVNFTVPNEPPLILSINYPELVVLDNSGSQSIGVNVSTYDVDGDNVTVSVSCARETTTAVAAFLQDNTGTCDVTESGIWKIDVSADDGKNNGANKVEQSVFMQVIEGNANRLPFILAVQNDGIPLDCQNIRPGEKECRISIFSDQLINIGIEAFDPDGDELTYSWTDGSTSTNTQYDGSDGSGSLVLTVSDGSGEDIMLNVQVEVKILPAPVLHYLYVDPYEMPANADGKNALAINAEAYGDNPAAPNTPLYYAWTLSVLDNPELLDGLPAFTIIDDGSGNTQRIFAQTTNSLSIAASSLDSGFYKIDVVIQEGSDPEDKRSDVHEVFFQILEVGTEDDSTLTNPVIVID